MNTAIDYTNLKMGLVENCFAVIPTADQALWESKGFKAYPDYPIFLSEKDPTETIMLGIPQTLSSFGTDALVNSTLLEISNHCGTYGMGGPGFLGFKLQTPSLGIRWLTFTIWCADQYTLLNNKLLGCHPAYNAQYHPWATKNPEKMPTRQAL